MENIVKLTVELQREDYENLVKLAKVSNHSLDIMAKFSILYFINKYFHLIRVQSADEIFRYVDGDELENQMKLF